MWYNGLLLTLLKSPLHFMLSGSMLVLRVIGRKTGTRIELPVNYTPDPGNPQRLLLTSQPDRTWWRNLRGGAPVEICLHGRWLGGRGEAFEDRERIRQGLLSLFRSRPNVARYFDVRHDETGAWKADDLDQASRSRVLIQLDLA
jgi:hypothetical protein